MFCRNCGSEMADNAAICVKCGVAKGEASNYCPNCGSETNENAAVCVSCGVALKNVKQSAGGGLTEGAKSKMVAGLLAIFLGHLGIHEFYLGDKKKGYSKNYCHNNIGSALCCWCRRYCSRCYLGVEYI